MAVYITDLYPAGDSDQFAYLFADSLAELLSIGGKIRMNPKWIRADGAMKYYIVSTEKRHLAILKNAVQITRQQHFSKWSEIKMKWISCLENNNSYTRNRRSKRKKYK